VCEYCLGESKCEHGASGGAPCSCSLAGPAKCPGCGCECAGWDWGLGFSGPATVRSFLGVGDDENPGFSEYPATKVKLLAAATEELQDAEANPADLAWLSKNLPDGTYSDRGSVVASLSSTISWKGDDAGTIVARLPMQAIATGSHLVVGREQSAVLVGKNGRPLDAFGPGDHVITRESAPRAAAESRPPAPQFPKSVISATPFIASTREMRTELNLSGRTRSGEAVTVRGTVAFSIGSAADFLGRAKSTGRGFTTKEAEAALTGLLGPAINQTLAAHDAREFDGPSKLLEDSIRSTAGVAGLRVSSVALNPVARMSASDQLAALHQRQAEALSHMPPEVQAQMAQAMERARAARGPPPPPAAGAGLAKPAAPPPPAAGAQVCPACQTPNPASVRFCGNCGKPLATKRVCPRCATEAAPGVKFCGNCGGPIG
jgi:Double zinc ribbon